MSDRFRVLVTDKIAASGLAALNDDDRFEVMHEDDSSTDAFRSALETAHALIVRSATTVTPALMEGAPLLRVVGRAGVGVDNIDIPAATERGIAVMNSPAGNTISAAELTMALLLAVVRLVPAADQSTRAGEWARGRFKGSELRGKALGLVGGGRIGSEVAKRARAFGMRVLLFDPFLPADRAREMGAEPLELDDLVERADVISLHIPLTDETKGLFGLERIHRMKKGSVLLNVARGGVIDEPALAQALAEGHLAGAALDVYAEEPLSEDSPLRAAPNLVMTPHLGASTGEAQERVAEEIAQGVASALADGDLSAALNAPGVGGEAMRSLAPLLKLGNHLGRLAVALAPAGIRELKIRYSGAREEGLSLLPRNVLVGVLQPALGTDGVNVVNAAVLAEARGMATQMTQVPTRGDFAEQIHLTVDTAKGSLSLKAAFLGPGHPRLVGIDGFVISVEPHGSLLILRNRDVPGVIGRVGSLLGERDINIADYHQARGEEGGLALAAIRTDGRVNPRVLGELRALPEVESAHWVDLG